MKHDFEMEVKRKRSVKNTARGSYYKQTQIAMTFVAQFPSFYKIPKKNISAVELKQTHSEHAGNFHGGCSR
jgi:hypothetical protein